MNSRLLTPLIIFVLVMLSCGMVYFADISLRSFYSSSLILFILPLAIVTIKRLDIAMGFFVISPLLPDISRDLLGLPVVNNVSICFSLLLLALFVHGLSRNFKFKELSDRYNALFILLSIVFAYEALKAASGPFAISSSQALISYWFSPLIIITPLFFASWMVRKGKEQTLFLFVRGIVWIGVLSFVVDKFQFGYSNKLEAGYWGTGNTTGNILAIGLPMVFLATQGSHRSKLTRLLPFLAIGVIVFSKSRGSILALIIMSLVWAIFFWGVSRNIKVGVSLVLLPLLLNVLSEQWNELTQTYHGLNEQDLAVVSSGRTLVWGDVRTYLGSGSNFFVGGGPFEFTLTSRAGTNTQNHLLRILISVGIIGLSVVVFIYGVILKDAVRSFRKSLDPGVKRASAALILSMVAAMTVGMFSHFLVGSKQMCLLWVVIGYCSARLSVSNRPAS
jgi:hypothetical protein